MTNSTQAPNQIALNFHQAPHWPTPLSNVVDRTTHTWWHCHPQPNHVSDTIPPHLWQSSQNWVEAALLWQNKQTMGTLPPSEPSNVRCNQSTLKNSTLNLDNNPRNVGCPKQWQCHRNSQLSTTHAIRHQRHLCSSWPPPTTHPRMHLQAHSRRTTVQIKTIHPIMDKQQSMVHLSWTNHTQLSTMTQHPRYQAVFSAQIIHPYPKQCGSSLFCQVTTKYDH